METQRRSEILHEKDVREAAGRLLGRRKEEKEVN